MSKSVHMNPPMPTAEQCTKRETVEWNGQRGVAGWYPQMGGTGGICVIHPAGIVGCFDVCVWHDGEFGFGDGEQNPVLLHHCDADQFKQFADDAVEAGLRVG